jgi:hypothetical protein
MAFYVTLRAFYSGRAVNAFSVFDFDLLASLNLKSVIILHRLYFFINSQF